MGMTQPTYAKGTTVSVERSRAEIDTLLGKYGATQRGIQTSETAAQVAFVIEGKKYRIDVPLPELREFRGDARKCEQGCRERWRCVVLLLKSKLQLVQLKMSTVEREFLADMVLPNGRTAGQELGDYMAKLLAEGYTSPLALPETT
jgi:hypothetical protein